MKIAVVSDTHLNTSMLDKILKETKDADIIFHLGDNVKDALYLEKNFNGDVYYVKGNCDIAVSADTDKVIEIEGKKFFLTHGHNYRVNYDLNNLYYKAKELNVDVAVYGHTHVKLIENYGDLYILNPGSSSLPRDGSKSMGFIEIDNGEIEITLKKI